MRTAQYVLELLRITGGSVYGKKKESESYCKKDIKEGKHIDCKQKIQRYGIPNVVFRS